MGHDWNALYIVIRVVQKKKTFSNQPGGSKTDFLFRQSLDVPLANSVLSIFTL